MINELSRRYLQELRAAQEQIHSSRLKEETHDGSDHEVYETLTSEYNFELGPLRVNVKKSKTVKGKTSTLSKSALSVANKNLETSSGSYSKEQLDHMRNLISPDVPQNFQIQKTIDIII